MYLANLGASAGGSLVGFITAVFVTSSKDKNQSRFCRIPASPRKCSESRYWIGCRCKDINYNMLHLVEPYVSCLVLRSQNIRSFFCGAASFRNYEGYWECAP